MAEDGGYLLDNADAAAAERLSALSTLFDPVTRRHVDALGVAAGWRCWEIGAGGATVPRWLVSRVTPGGYVLATDIDVSQLPTNAGFDVRWHDVGRDDPPDGGFDLVHARLVLVHVPERDRALAAMVAALRPGGWLLVEEADPALQPLVSPDAYDDASRLANRLKDGFRQLMAERGVDLAFGRTLPRRLREAGLDDVRADAWFPVAGPECVALERATIAQIGPRLLSAGIASDNDLRRHLANIHERPMDLATSPLVSAWGRRPLNG